MSKKVFFAALFSVVVGLVGCGDDKKLKKEDYLNQSDSGNCGFNVVSDYNSVVSACNWDGKSACETKKAQFLAKYPNINCKAETGTGLDKKTVTIDRRRIESF